MISKDEIKFHDSFSGITLHDSIALQAAKAVAMKCEETGDGLLMLDMLGLVPPQDGNEPTTIAESKAELNRIRRNTNRADARTKKKDVD